MTVEQAGAWVMVITAIGGAIASVIAAWKSTQAAKDANAAKHQGALNNQVAERVDAKLDENNRMTAEIHGMTQKSGSDAK